jgi:hypothetical protein
MIREGVIPGAPGAFGQRTNSGSTVASGLYPRCHPPRTLVTTAERVSDGDTLIAISESSTNMFQAFQSMWSSNDGGKRKQPRQVVRKQPLPGLWLFDAHERATDGFIPSALFSCIWGYAFRGMPMRRWAGCILLDDQRGYLGSRN